MGVGEWLDHLELHAFFAEQRQQPRALEGDCRGQHATTAHVLWNLPSHP